METIQQRVRQSDGHRATAKTAFTHSVSRQKLVTAHQRQELIVLDMPRAQFV